MSKIKKDPKQILLTIVKNSLGSKMFQNLPVQIDGEDTDVVKGGDLSCAFFVSGILSMLGMVKGVHATVDSTVKDLEDSGFQKIDEFEYIEGDIIVWEGLDFGEGGIHKHIGFYIGDGKAISNSEKMKVPIEHSIKLETNGRVRKVDSVYRLKLE